MTDAFARPGEETAAGAATPAADHPTKSEELTQMSTETISMELPESEAIGDGFDEIRHRANAVHDILGIAKSQLAEEAGVANATFQAFLNGTYGGRNDRVAAKVEAWLNTRQAAQQRAALLPADVPWQPTETAGRITAALEYAHLQPTISLIACGAGTGKTVTCEHYARTNSRVFLATMDPDCTTNVRMMDEVAYALGLPKLPQRGRKRTLVDALKGRHTLLIIDEAQVLQRPQLEMLRTFHDQARCGLAIVGNQHVAEHRQQDAWSWGQFESRVGARLHIDQPSADDVDKLLFARGIDDEGVLALLRKIGARPGALRMMGQIINAAGLLASANGDGQVTVTHVRAAMRERNMTVPGAR